MNKKVAIIGTGNLAHHLVPPLMNCSYLSIKTVLARNFSKTKEFAIKHNLRALERIDQIDNVDLIFCLVVDDNIYEISSQLSDKLKKEALFVHASGIKGHRDIDPGFRSSACFYPVQSFSSEDRDIQFNNVPVCIVSGQNETSKFLKSVADEITDKAYIVDDEEKKKIHLAAVFVNNFTNHLIALGYDILQGNNIDHQILFPLIEKTFDKLKFLDPNAAQTGPAIRNDIRTMKTHLEMLKNEEMKELIYKTISKSIIHNFNI